MVGHAALDRVIGVRIPASQPYPISSPHLTRLRHSPRLRPDDAVANVAALVADAATACRCRYAWISDQDADRRNRYYDLVSAAVLRGRSHRGRGHRWRRSDAVCGPGSWPSLLGLAAFALARLSRPAGQSRGCARPVRAGAVPGGSGPGRRVSAGRGGTSDVHEPARGADRGERRPRLCRQHPGRHGRRHRRLEPRRRRAHPRRHRPRRSRGAARRPGALGREPRLRFGERGRYRPREPHPSAGRRHRAEPRPGQPGDPLRRAGGRRLRGQRQGLRHPVVGESGGGDRCGQARDDRDPPHHRAGSAGPRGPRRPPLRHPVRVQQPDADLRLPGRDRRRPLHVRRPGARGRQQQRPVVGHRRGHRQTPRRSRSGPVRVRHHDRRARRGRRYPGHAALRAGRRLRGARLRGAGRGAQRCQRARRHAGTRSRGDGEPRVPEPDHPRRLQRRRVRRSGVHRARAVAARASRPGRGPGHAVRDPGERRRLDAGGVGGRVRCRLHRGRRDRRGARARGGRCGSAGHRPRIGR